MTFVHFQDIHAQVMKYALYGQLTSLADALSTMDINILHEVRSAIHVLDAAITTAMLGSDQTPEPIRERW